MNTAESLSHAKWECKYHIVWIPKYRKKTLYKELRQHLGLMLRNLATQKDCTILGGVPTLWMGVKQAQIHIDL